jgi:hypothetical protein
MNPSSRFRFSTMWMVISLAGSSGGCAAIVGADFDVSARPDPTPSVPSNTAMGGVEGPRLVSSWKVSGLVGAKLLGLSVAIDGDTGLIGARSADWAGQVIVVQRSDGEAWDPTLTLTAEQYASENALFGSSVALSGDWAVIGASADKKEAPGTAYFFHRVGELWSLTQEVRGFPSSVDGDKFGTRVAIENDVAVIGAPGAGPDQAAGGAAYVFRLGAGGSWIETQRLVPPDGRLGDFFGFELALHSTTLVVGSPFNDEAGTEAGAVYAFERSGSEWYGAPKKLTPRASDAAGYRMGFGTIGLEEGLLLVPATTGVDAYQLDAGGDWVADTLEPPRGLVAQDSSWRAAIRGARAVLAVGTSDNVGMGLLYERTDGRWRFVERLVSGSSNQEDLFGWTIAYDGTTACFGAIFAEGKDGAVHFFDLSE